MLFSILVMLNLNSSEVDNEILKPHNKILERIQSEQGEMKVMVGYCVAFE